EDAVIVDIKAQSRAKIDLPILEVSVPKVFTKTDVSLGIMHKLKRVVYSLSLARKLKTILKNATEKVVLHFHNQYNLFFFLKLTSKKLLQKATVAYTVHSYIWGDEWEKIEKTVRKKYFQEIFCVKNADKVLVLNDITTDHFVKRLGVDKAKIIKVQNGVNTTKYSPLSSKEVDNFKREQGLEDKKIIFQVGSVCERKNQLGTVEMLADYLKQNPNTAYLYAGGVIDGEYQNAIMEKARQNGIEAQVKYVGELAPGEELNRYYNAAKVSVFTSKLESFGLVIIEAISSGTPVIVGSNLMFTLDGGYSIYNNAQEFVSLVEAALENNKKTNCSRFAEGYSWDRVARQHKYIFSK
ncbi:MAG: glycosyltransferase family 4 protein, partial [Clostridia bacterium]|nr:glycosyltransferase family 4 protein [Clostridia bacterium]